MLEGRRYLQVYQVQIGESLFEHRERFVHQALSADSQEQEVLRHSRHLFCYWYYVHSQIRHSKNECKCTCLLKITIFLFIPWENSILFTLFQVSEFVPRTVIEYLTLTSFGVQLNISNKIQMSLGGNRLPMSKFLDYLFPFNMSPYMPLEGVHHK